MKYKVTCVHHRKAVVKGDLEAESVIQSAEVFSSKKDIVKYLTQKADEAKRRGYKFKLNSSVRGNMPSLSVYTGVAWIHENTGEQEREYYYYRTEAV
jgi:hypothetical protein